MPGLIRSLLFILVAVIASGCASVSKQAYKAPAEPIRSVLIATPEEFPKVRIGLGGNIGLMFGAVGAAAAAYDVEERSNALHNAVASQGFSYHQYLVEKIKASLAAAGIRSETVAVKRGRSILVEDYRPLVAQKNVDAVLDIFVSEASYGGTHPLLDPELRPILRVSTRLVSAKTFDTLYADDISFGYSNPFMPAQEIKSPKQYYYPNLDTALTDKAKTAEGLRVAADEVARFLTQQFAPAGATSTSAALTVTKQ